MMHMTFYWGTSATLLFDSWVTKTLLQYLLSVLAIFVFAILHEWLFEFRSSLSKKGEGNNNTPHDTDGSVPLLKRVPAPKGKNKTLLITLLYGINAGTGYLLMLLVMSFNGGVFLAIVLGLTVGFGLFRSVLDSFSNCCESLHP